MELCQTNGTAAIEITPSSLFGITRSKLNVGKSTILVKFLMV